MHTFEHTLNAIAADLEKLKVLEAQVRSSGPVAESLYSIDSTTNKAGTTYYQLREKGKVKYVRSLKGKDLRDWKERIARRNVLKDIESAALYLKGVEEKLRKSTIGWNPD